MANYEKYLSDNWCLKDICPKDLFNLAKEILKLRQMLWINHGHKGIYGDDGEMQCSECIKKYGFWDWKRTDIDIIESKIQQANMLEMSIQKTTKAAAKLSVLRGRLSRKENKKDEHGNHQTIDGRFFRC